MKDNILEKRKAELLSVFLQKLATSQALQIRNKKEKEKNRKQKMPQAEILVAS